MPAQTWESLLNVSTTWSAVDGTALASSVSEAIISPTGPDFTFPANYWTVGQKLRITAFGKYSTTSNPTMIWQLRYGGLAGTSLLTTSTQTMGTTQTNLPWKFEAIITVRALGSSGSFFPSGQLMFHTTTSASTTLLLPTSAPAAVTVDTTAAKSLVLTGQWGTSSSSNTITCNEFLIEQVD